MALRAENRAVNLVPRFSPSTFKYFATLDFAMDSFSVDALPADGCQVDGVPNQAILVGRGLTYRQMLWARNLHGQKRQKYEVTIKRLGGSETEVQSLRINGAILTPAFTPQVRKYKADLAIGYDLIKLDYELRDSGQKVRCRSAEQELVPASAVSQRLLATAPGRSLKRVGEVQYYERYQAFPIDAGYRRTVTLTIESADPMQADVGTYIVEVTRQGCTAAKPFYDAETRTCHMHCPAHFYPNLVVHRCSECNTNCAVCSSLLQCELCKEDTLHRSYLIQADGSCLEVQRSILDKYNWWFLSAAMFGALLACIGVLFLCQCLFTLCCCRKRRVYDIDSDSDFDADRMR